MRRAREANAKVIQVNIAEDNTIARAALSRLGFKYVRQFLKYKLDMVSLSWQAPSQAAQECCHLRQGEEYKLTEIQNVSFAEHWGYNPNTLETTTYRINLSRCSPEDIIITCAGDRITGYCWTGPTDQQTGQIYMLGVAPDYRGKGIGRRLLLAGLAHLRSKGLQVAELTVDSENSSARALYQSIGFENRASTLWYEKVIS
ncbi:GNAT family N-acetyltransferase [Chloroflexota bacterium]